MPAKRQPGNQDSAALESYLNKRNLGTSPEPGPQMEQSNDSPSGNDRIFVVQEHHARSHHFDLRLELDGVLKSWAVPKGPSLDPAVKRLAVRVEDHPLEYAGFQGIIPPGNYGAGKVEIWDRGTWVPMQADEDPAEALAKGRLKFRLAGEKLRGDFLLTRIGGAHQGGDQWLVSKLRESPAGGGRLSHSRPGRRRRSAGDHPPPSPQLSKLAASVPGGADWIHEVKFDGYRVIARKRGQAVTIITRGGHDWTARFGDLAERIGEVSDEDFTMDGEVVVFDENGRSDFGRLQDALGRGGSGSYVFAVFDLLDFAGKDIAVLPLLSRKELLREIVPEGNSRILFSRHWSGPAEGRQLFEQACRLKLEGIISKETRQPYLPGSRQSWRKIKCDNRQEFVICGYTAPRNAGAGFGALVLGSYEAGRLIPRGKVGTGFSDRQRREILAELEERRLSVSPFGGGGQSEEVTWVRPDMIAEVRFAELTRDGFIRHGSFVGLREDKRPGEVHLEVEPEAPQGNPVVCGIAISNPGREIYPGTGITKLDVCRYYESVADLMLPYLVKRPLAFLRAPTGITGQIFFQKHFSAHLPKGVRMRTLPDEDTRICHIADAAGLLSLVQFGVLEFHPWGSLMTRPDKPDMLIWDLDPDVAVPWREVLGAAFLLRDVLAGAGLRPVVKTSGGKGLHVVVFCKPRWPWERLKPLTRRVSELLASHNPRRLTVQAAKSKRTGKIFIDWLRNGRGATCVAPWSLRARGEGPVALPVNWGDLPSATPDGVTLRNIVPAMPSEWREAADAPDEVTAALLIKLGG